MDRGGIIEFKQNFFPPKSDLSEKLENRFICLTFFSLSLWRAHGEREMVRINEKDIELRMKDRDTLIREETHYRGTDRIRGIRN